MSTPTETAEPQVANEPHAAGLQLYTIEEAMIMLRMGRTTIFDLLRNGRLNSVREGRSRRIPPRAIAEYIALLEREEAKRNAE
jgi:excisionase family DNA binding protein